MDICLYFHIHHPYYLRHYLYNDTQCYFDEKGTKEIMQRYARHYLAVNDLLYALLQEYREIKIAFDFSGVLLELCQAYCPVVLNSFQKLVATRQLSLLAHPYYHSLASLYDSNEFDEQLDLQAHKVNELFGIQPTVVSDTDLIYQKNVHKTLHAKGYNALLVQHALDLHNDFSDVSSTDMPIFIKNSAISDRLENLIRQSSTDNHLFKECIDLVNCYKEASTLHIGIDYTTIARHEKMGSAVILKKLISALLRMGHSFISPDAAECHSSLLLPLGQPSFFNKILGNALQKKAAEKVYALAPYVRLNNDSNIRHQWRLLQVADHFYYMNIDTYDQSAHNYYNPYGTPYEAFIYFMNIYNDIADRVVV